MKWKLLTLTATALELITLTVQFGIPAIQGRAFGDPRFPHLIVFHGDVPNSDIVDFRGNFYESALQSWIFRIVAVLGVVLIFKLLRKLWRRIVENSRSTN
jgi:hypothetical protein